MSFVATAIVGSAAVGAAVTAYSANKAADAQIAAADKAAQTTLGMYNTTRGDLAPFRQMGVDAGSTLQSRLTDLTTPINLPDAPKPLTQEELEKTPGYQFTRQQGLKATQNSAAARGLGVSGAALKGAATFATGLADNTYEQRFANEQALFGNRQKLFEDTQTNQSNAYNRLKGLVDVGENAAAQTGVIGSKAATDAAGAQIGAGNAAAAAINTTGAAITKGASDIGGYMAYKGLYGGNQTPGIGAPNNVIAGNTAPYIPNPSAPWMT